METRLGVDFVFFVDLSSLGYFDGFFFRNPRTCVSCINGGIFNNRTRPTFTNAPGATAFRQRGGGISIVDVLLNINKVVIVVIKSVVMQHC